MLHVPKNTGLFQNDCTFSNSDTHQLWRYIKSVYSLTHST